MRIVAAACKLENGVILSLPRPARHHHILHATHPVAEMAEQGFLTDEGTFATREEARAMHPEVTFLHHKWAFSEDFW